MCRSPLEAGVNYEEESTRVSKRSNDSEVEGTIFIVFLRLGLFRPVTGHQLTCATASVEGQSGTLALGNKVSCACRYKFD